MLALSISHDSKGIIRMLLYYGRYTDVIPVKVGQECKPQLWSQACHNQVALEAKLFASAVCGYPTFVSIGLCSSSQQ